MRYTVAFSAISMVTKSYHRNRVAMQKLIGLGLNSILANMDAIVNDIAVILYIVLAMYRCWP